MDRLTFTDTSNVPVSRPLNADISIRWMLVRFLIVYFFLFLRAAVSAVVALLSPHHSVVRVTAVLEIKYVCM